MSRQRPIYAPPTMGEALAIFRDMVNSSEEMPPQLILGYVDRILNVPIAGSGLEPRDACMTVAEVIANGSMPQPRWALFASEGYVATAPVDNPDALKDVEHGELAERAAIGMDVPEALIVLYVDSERRWFVHQGFTRKAALNAVSWGELIRDESGESVGVLPEALAIMVRPLS